MGSQLGFVSLYFNRKSDVRFYENSRHYILILRVIIYYKLTAAERARRKILCKRYSTKSRMALESRADSGLNPLFAESHGGQNGMRAGTA